MNKRYSYSQFDLYSQCPRRYKYRYIDKLRSPKLPSPLFFGGALDEGFSALLATKKRHLSDEEFTTLTTKSAEEVFVQNMQIVKDVYKNPVELPKNLNADYFNSDFTAELLSLEHLPSLQEFEPKYSLLDFVDFHHSCREQLGARRVLLPDDKLLYNYMTWLTLVEKGKLMIGAYRDIILPQIDIVEDIQKRISITNPDGDEITGLIDFTARFKGSDDLYICDNKSSSTAYSEDSVRTSDQLATYCEAEGVKTAAYVVLEKKMRKRDPKIRATVIKDEISEEQMNLTFDKFTKIVYNIQAGKFDKNESSCYAFGRPCEYLKLCKYKDCAGLINLREEK